MDPPGTSASAEDLQQPRLQRLLPAVLLGTAFVLMAAWSWGTWPDAIVDFGNELYAAWRLSLGQVLVRDVAWASTSSLPPYWNALLFKLFGAGLQTLVVANLAILATIAWLLQRLLTVVAGVFWSTVAVLFFLLVFAYSQYVGIGNYNFVAPYSHGVTHGMLLALGSIALRWRFARTGAARDLAAASFCVGLVFLTKPEFFVATAGAAVIDLAFQLRAESAAGRRARWVAVAVLPALIGPVISLALLSLAAGPRVALVATLGPWLHLATPLSRTPFYLAGLGLDHPVRNLLFAVEAVALVAAFLVPIALLDRRLGLARLRWVAAGLLSAALLLAAWQWFPPGTWIELARGLPLGLLLGGPVVLLSAWRAESGGSPDQRLHVGLAAFAGLLLLKLGLNARLYHYGFALAMPATLLMITWLGAAIPAALRRRGGSGIILQAAVLTAVALFAAGMLAGSSRLFSRKTHLQGSGSDLMRVDERGAVVQAVIEWLSVHAQPGDTLAVLPEGVMINYLARLKTPSPFLTFLPDAIAWQGEPALLAPLQVRPPTFVLVVSRDASEHGARTFGVDYAVATWTWIQANYRPVGRVGGSPFVPGEYGMVMLQRREARR